MCSLQHISHASLCSIMAMICIAADLVATKMHLYIFYEVPWDFIEKCSMAHKDKVHHGTCHGNYARKGHGTCSGRRHQAGLQKAVQASAGACKLLKLLLGLICFCI